MRNRERGGLLVVAAYGALAGGFVLLRPVTGAFGAAPPDGSAQAEPTARTYVVVDTGQTSCYDDQGRVISPKPGQPFYGQDAQFNGPQPSYQDHGDGTVSDLNTGLMWVQARGEKMTWPEALASAPACRVGGHTDWRMPTIKELYSLINFTGGFHLTVADSVPYLDAKHFGFVYGNEAAGERPIDCQDWSATEYRGTTMGGNATVFGVNFADGRIKGYPKARGPRGVTNKLYVRYVRGNPSYGRNDFQENDGTIADRATGLVWQKADSGRALNWQQALAYAEDLELAGHSDWRLPNAKELQSIVDYTRAPSATHSPAIDPVFQTSVLSGGEYPWYWTSTTHLDGPPDVRGRAAIYIAFGTAWGYMWGQWLDVHGAGAQRSDPKSGDPAWFPYGRGPQGDQIRIYNYVRCVRGGLEG